MDKKNIVMAGGGTGGHVFPIRSLIQTALSLPEYNNNIENIYRFGGKGSLEEQVAREFGGTVKFRTIYNGKWRRESGIWTILRNLFDGFRLIIGIIQNFFLLQIYHIDSVFCKGGYVALPVVIAAKILSKKIVIHESDTHPGLVNRIASKWSDDIFMGFDGVFKQGKVVGQILSDDLIDPSFDYDKIPDQKKTKPTIFITGGSQGAKTLYQTLANILDKNSNITEGFDIIISLGKLNEDLKIIFNDKNIKIFDFLDQASIGKIYQKSDLCLTRGGTTSLAEQKLFGVKSIIVPLPQTHDQTDNARYFVEKYQDIMLDQRSTSFQSQLEECLIQHLHRHKHSFHQNPLKQIQETKKLILNAILY
ncbi:UDP-N-acetylglucosamine--N-acetylmuramyl-(pentapeptide) pyrophosphoryl-undecaprenol N-acetylglucosamine transferase [candidate division SR1 bacterium]|nr:UDP-N-acetylglucosamine--N-acetylmuramyl-(pentapeptide) pyrophosphoryl-undecaprenol N-acetylglucosamine transferase [candidate division SR1 bacterium]